MGLKPKKIPMGATQNIDIVLFENHSGPRLRITVTKNEPEKISKVKYCTVFATTEKILTKNN